MPFETYETGRYTGKPVELYLFRYGPGVTDYFAYTNSEKAKTHDDGSDLGPVTYEPIAFSHDTIKSSGTLDKSAFKVRAPRDIGVADLFRVYPPSYVVTLTIFHGHLSDPDAEFLVAWAGRVLGYQREGSEAVMTCEPVSTSMRRVGLRRHYQIGCPHLLYGEDCRAEEILDPAEVESMTGVSVTLVDGWATVDITKYRQGIFRWTNADGRVEIRQVLGVTAPNTLRLNGLLRDLEIGTAVTVSKGCNHQHTGVGGEGDCVNLHANGPNYGGCRWIPTKNPIGANNRFY